MTFSPNLGRWIEPDPIGFEGGDTDLYRFVGDNPATFTDPIGLARRVGRFTTPSGAVWLYDVYDSGGFSLWGVLSPATSLYSIARDQLNGEANQIRRIGQIDPRNPNRVIIPGIQGSVSVAAVEQAVSAGGTTNWEAWFRQHVQNDHQMQGVAWRVEVGQDFQTRWNEDMALIRLFAEGGIQFTAAAGVWVGPSRFFFVRGGDGLVERASTQGRYSRGDCRNYTGGGSATGAGSWTD